MKNKKQSFESQMFCIHTLINWKQTELKRFIREEGRNPTEIERINLFLN
jgi:hypothetical protein